MASRNLESIEKQIKELQRCVESVGHMRPGTLSVQYRDPANRKTPFNQISYTYQGRSRSEYVRPENIDTVRQEIEAYRQFKALCAQIIDLSILASRMRSGTRQPLRRTRKAK
jgi:hypothetical protein